MITIYPNQLAVNEPRYIDISKAIERIRSGGHHKELIQRIRDGETGLKKSLPAYSFSGKFLARNDKSCLEHSGFICLDFDKTPKEALLKDLRYVYCAFLSPSGTGVKVIVRVPPEIENHSAYFDALREYYSYIQGLDVKTRDISRLCYDSYDPDIYVNTESEVFTRKIERPQYERTHKPVDIPITAYSSIYQRLRKWMENSGEFFVHGNRNSYLFKLTASCNRFGIPKADAEHMLSEFLQDGFGQEEITKTIASAYANTSEFNTCYFEDNTVRPRAQGMIRDGKTDQEIIEVIVRDSGVDQDKAREIVSDVRTQISNLNEFWTVSTKGRVDIHLQDFLAWLNKHGIYRYVINSEGKWILIRIDNNVVEIVDETFISHLVLNHLKDYPPSITEYFIRNSERNYKPSILAHLPSKTITWNRDDRDRAWFYFSNTAVIVSKSGIKEIPYTDIPHCIWKTQILTREFTRIDNEDELMRGNFAQFLYIVSAGTDQQTPQGDELFHKMIKITGFMMHGFKDRAKPGALIITDERSLDAPEGGTGKGIYMTGLRKFKRSAVFDGKSFNFDKNFLWQRVSQDTQIIYIEDVKKNFDFERLFSALTEGIEIERKNKDSFYLSYENSPKIAISTNYTLKGEGTSNRRRRIEVEFKNFFNESLTPLDYFGRILFDDWDERQWNLFDSFMLLCCQLYLANDLDKTLSDSMKEKHLIANTAPEFVAWADDFILPNTFYVKSIIMDAFLSDYKDFHWLKVRTFVQWLEKWAQARNLSAVDSRINVAKGIMFRS